MKSGDVMSLATFFLIIVSVSLSSVAQIALKAGMSASRVLMALGSDRPVDGALAIVSTPFVWVGIALYGFSATSWLFVLAKVEVSLAYPFVGLGFLLTAALAVVFLGETMTLVRIIGTCLVAIGVVLVALK
jgi:drug/metabolite transporter (DMT)-like permease